MIKAEIPTATYKDATALDDRMTVLFRLNSRVENLRGVWTVLVEFDHRDAFDFGHAVQGFEGEILR